MNAQVFKVKSSSIFLSILLILLLCLFFIIIPARGLSHKFALAVEQEPEIHEAEAVHIEEVHEETEHEEEHAVEDEEEAHEEAGHEEEHVVVEHEEETHEDAGHETIGHGEAEGEAGEGIEIPSVVDAALLVAIAALILGAGKILEGYAKKVA